MGKYYKALLEQERHISNISSGSDEFFYTQDASDRAFIKRTELMACIGQCNSIIEDLLVEIQVELHMESPTMVNSTEELFGGSLVFPSMLHVPSSDRLLAVDNTPNYFAKDNSNETGEFYLPEFVLECL